MADTAETDTATAAVEDDEDVLTFSTDDSEAAEPEPDTATTQPPAEEQSAEPEAGPSVDEGDPSEPETTAGPDESQNLRPAFQQPSCAAVDDKEAMKRRQARFGIEPPKPSAKGVRQGGVAKRPGNAFAASQQSIAFKQASGPGRGQGFVGQRGRGVGSFTGRGRGMGAMMHTRPPIGGSNMAFGPPDPHTRAPRPPSHPPPLMGGSLQRPDMMGNAFANIKHANSAGHKASPHPAGPKMAAMGAPAQKTPFTPTAAPFRPRMPASQNGARPPAGGMGQIGKPAAAQVAKASTWVRSEAAPKPVVPASGFAAQQHAIEKKSIATASTWINPKLKAGGPSATPAGSAVQNAFAAKPPAAGAPSIVGGNDKDAEIMALKARLEELEHGGKRKAEDSGVKGGAGSSRGEGTNGKRHRQMNSSEPHTAGAAAEGKRAKLGILERLQFGSQRGGAGTSSAAVAADGGAQNYLQESDRPQREHRSDGGQRQMQRDSPPRQHRRKRQPDPAPPKDDFSDNQRRRIDRFAARG